MSQTDKKDIQQGSSSPAGILAEFESTDALVSAAHRVREAGYRKWDAHSPFPVHGIDGAIGIRATILPWLVLGAGLTGLAGGLLMQWFTNTFDYPFVISGKPLFSLPANIPITFETTVLLSALAAFFGMLGLNRLPQFYNWLFRSARFRRVTTDGFFISIDKADPKFDPEGTARLLQDAGASQTEVIAEPDAPALIPKPFLVGALVLATLALIPASLAVRARFTKSEKTRIHLIPDMDFQPKYKAQAASPLFSDGRAMRSPVAGTVARGDLRADEAFYLGKQDGEWVKSLPVPATQALMMRGMERFDIYCATCHGASGYGDGLIARRAESLQQGTWVPPTSLHEKRIREQADGELYNVIANGVRTMPAYASQIEPEERWAIVLYLRALQRSQNASIDDVPSEVRSSLEKEADQP